MSYNDENSSPYKHRRIERCGYELEGEEYNKGPMVPVPHRVIQPHTEVVHTCYHKACLYAVLTPRRVTTNVHGLDAI